MNDLDQIDRNILRILSKDGRITNLELANQVGLSPSACLRRVQDLEARKVITGYRATFDRHQTGGGFLAYITVGLSNHSKESQKQFEQAMAAAAQVRDCLLYTSDAADD